MTTTASSNSSDDAAQFLSVKHFAQLADMGESTVRKMVHDGRLPAIRFGETIRIPRSVVDPHTEEGGSNGR